MNFLKYIFIFPIVLVRTRKTLFTNWKDNGKPFLGKCVSWVFNTHMSSLVIRHIHGRYFRNKKIEVRYMSFWYGHFIRIYNKAREVDGMSRRMSLQVVKRNMK